MLENFNEDESKIICLFLQSALQVFEKPILLLQNSKLLLPELLDIMNGLKEQISKRLSGDFFGAKTVNELHLIELENSRQAGVLESQFAEFYNATVEYIEKWFHLEHVPTNISWVMLSSNEVAYSDVKNLSSQIAPDIAKKDELFDEVSQLNALFKKITQVKDSAEEKWKKLFKVNNFLPCLYRLVCMILSIPVSNAFMERIFSLCGAQWTKERNFLNVATVKSLLQVKVNFDYPCCQMQTFILNNAELRRKLRGCEKY